MAVPIATCIYCGSPFDPTRGEGDHIIPDALGHFEGRLIFRGACPRCNGRAGNSEQQLLRCAPEAFIRQMLQPVTSRGNRGNGPAAANGMPSPRQTINRGDHQELVEPSQDNPRDILAVDQLVVTDNERGTRYIRLNPNMTAARLRERINALAPNPSGTCYLHCDETVADRYTALMREVFPDGTLTEREGDDAGVRRVRGRVEFRFHDDYWRAIAKIGFHYYLLNNRRGFRGDEPEFTDIRRFIMEGGDRGPFFSKPAARFVLPFGELPNGNAVLPQKWAHVLAADESFQTAVAMVCLFVGPERPPVARHINLGRFRSPIVVPNARTAHAYEYDAEPSQGRYAGRVVEITTTRLR
jgi:hypothetical protein